jgi:hypothetical protein
VKNGLIKISICCCLVTLVACGSGSGSSDTSNSGDAVGAANSAADQTVVARINAANAEQLGIAATEGAKQSVQYQSVANLGFRPAGKSGFDIVSEKLSLHYAERTAAAPAPPDCVSGSAVEFNNPDGSTTVTFSNCIIDLGLGPDLVLEIDGVVESWTTVTGNLTTVDLVYDNFSLDLAGDITLLNLEVSCTTDNATTQTSCNFPGTPGIDGRVYVFSDASVSGDELSGYSIRVAIDDPDHGSFVVDTTTPILFGCGNGQPSSGALQFTDGAGVLVSVTFNDCASYTVSYSGTSAMFLW